MSFIDPILDSVDSFLEWISSSLKQTTASYCQVETAVDEHTLVARDGSLISIIALKGIKFLPGEEEFLHLVKGMAESLNPVMHNPGHILQLTFHYDTASVQADLKHMLAGAQQTARRLALDLDDLFNEKINVLARYCAREQVYLAVWTTQQVLAKRQAKIAIKRKNQAIKQNKIPTMRDGQAIFVPLLDLKDAHQSFVRAVVSDLKTLNMTVDLLDIHTDVSVMRNLVDPEFSSPDWGPYLPGDKIPVRADIRRTKAKYDISELMWPPLSRQIIPRDAELLDLRTARIGDRMYAPIFITLFPKDLRPFTSLLQRTLAARIPWRMNFNVVSGGQSAFGMKSTMAAILSFANSFNPLINDAKKLLDYIAVNTDDAIVKLQVCLVTWAGYKQEDLLRTRAAELAKAVQSWGNCDVGEISGDSLAGVLSTIMGISTDNVAPISIAPMSDVIRMLPITRPASPWTNGAILFRSPDGKPWPYQPGSSIQTTWIDLVYARPGSGKSVLSNAINLALCLSPGIERLPRIAIIDIGPSSSGLISLIKEALPKDQQHLAAYHRILMTQEFAINPCDTQLGSRYPTPQERSFLVNFLSLLATPIGDTKSYDGMNDMAGMVIDELYKQLADDGNPRRYATNMDTVVDAALATISVKIDEQTSWWEIVDALFTTNHIREAYLAQRFAVPLIADAVSICRAANVSDLFGKVIAPSGEPLITAFSRMISSAIREYPVLSRVTQFDLGEARIVSLDLDEVARTGGDAADRQTAVMYMIARYILAKDFYLTIENLGEIPVKYRDYHRARIQEIREDPKRLVLDEFHRTAHAKSVRDQVIVDMREGRKWKVQVALLSQSLDDFDAIMVEFATSIFIMDAGPVSSIEKSAKIFGLSPTERQALRMRVHGPRAGGGTFLAQFATNDGINTQLITNTLGPIELWAFSTTADDARVRNELYAMIGPKAARQVLAALYPHGSIAHVVEQRRANLKEEGKLDEEASKGVVAELIQEILAEYKKNAPLHTT